MEHEVETNGYLMLIRGTEWHKGLSPEELQKYMGTFMGWVDGLRTSGVLKDAHPLSNEGRVVSGAKGSIVADGPFAESKEAVGGYFSLDVATIEEAVKIAQECPALEFGCTMEVRPIALDCPLLKQLDPEMAQGFA